jgi:death-on-curing family protein
LKFLSYEDIIYINHECQLISQDVVLVTYGIRDESLLNSIPISIKQTYDGIYLYPDIHSKASHLWYTLSQYHCFYDGNKRTGLACMLIYLLQNGIKLPIVDDLYDMCMELSKSKVSKIELIEYLKKNSININIDFKTVVECFKYYKNEQGFKDIIIKLSQ